MKPFKLFLLSIAANLCIGSIPTFAFAGIISNHFYPYLKRFADEAYRRNVYPNQSKLAALSIRFAFNLGDYNHLAECEVNTTQISVSESYWMTASEPEREELIFHELGHCLLGRDHDDNVMPISGGTIYKSIMNSAGTALMFRFPNWNNCFKNTADCSSALIFDPKSKTNFYNRYHKIYLDELFNVIADETPEIKPFKIKKNAKNLTQAPATKNSIETARASSPTGSTQELENTFRFQCEIKFKSEMTAEQARAKCAELLNSMKKTKNGITPFYLNEIADYPKLRKGMTKQQVLETFGKPESVSHDGQAIHYSSKDFCSSSDHSCTVYFFSNLSGEPPKGVTSWQDFKYQFTDSLEH